MTAIIMKSLTLSGCLLLMNFTSFFSFHKSLASLVAIAVPSSNASSVTPISQIVMPQIQTIVRNITTTTPTTTTNSKTSTLDSKSKRVLEAKRIIQSADVVCFDVDSTVIREEGIDELAEFCGKGEEVSNLTKEAMGGAMTFQEALRRRLDIIKPSQSQIREFLMQRPSTLSPKIR